MDSITDICYDFMPDKEGRIRAEFIKPLEIEIQQLQAEIEHLKARIEKSVELPCKDGTRIWVLSELLTGGWEIIESLIVEYRVHSNRVVLSYFVNCPIIGNTIETDIETFGKTVFLTREEAEKALERSK